MEGYTKQLKKMLKKTAVILYVQARVIMKYGLVQFQILALL